MFLEALTSTVSTPNGDALKWDSDGYYVFGEDNWRDIEVEATFIYKDGSIGILPRFYSPYTYMYFTIGKMLYETDSELNIVEEKDMMIFSLFTNGDSVELGKKDLDLPLVPDEVYTLKVTITRYNYQIYVNDVLEFNIDYGGETSGNTCLYATTGNECTEISVLSTFPEGWVTNVEGINESTAYLSEASNEERSIRLENPVNAIDALYAEQILTVTPGKDIAFTSSYTGECKMVVTLLEGVQTGMTKEVFAPLQETWTRIEGSASIPADCTKVSIRFMVQPGKEASVKEPQLEMATSATSYIPNTSTTEPAVRTGSFLTFPAKEAIHPTHGTMSMWVRPNETYTAAVNKRYMLFQYGDTVDGIIVCGEGASISMQHGSSFVAMSNVGLTKDTWNHIAITWGEASIGLHVNGVSQYAASESLFQEESETINVGIDRYSDYEVFHGAIDDLTIYKVELNEDEVFEIFESTEAVAAVGDMTFRATFDHAIGNFQKTYVEIPNSPAYGSPVIVQKEDGTELRKVSFFDYESGEYRTWNEEEVVYYGGDYIKVSFHHLDTTNFRVTVMDQAGNLLGDPHTIVGDKIYLTLSEEERKKYKRKTLRVRYQLEDSYTVDFNIEAADSFRLDIAKHDGQEVEVVYEGNRYSEEKLVEMVEMNPILNPNHKGFLYITNEQKPITSFKTKITPGDLPADGLSDALIIIEPVDEIGNHVCEANLEVSAEYGVIHPNLEMESVRLRQIAGRYIYKYIAPSKFSSTKGEIENITDKIKIIDKETGIGIEKTITLCLYDEYQITPPDATDEKAISPELMGAFLLEKVVEYIGQPIEALPVELRELNFTKSGVVNIKDVSWIKDKLYTTDLQKAYQNILLYTQER